MEIRTKVGLNSPTTRSRTRALAISLKKQEGLRAHGLHGPVAKWLGNGDEGNSKELNTGYCSAIYGSKEESSKD